MLAQCEGLPLNLTFDATVYEVGDKNKAKAAKGKAVLSGILSKSSPGIIPGFKLIFFFSSTPSLREVPAVVPGQQRHFETRGG